MKSFNLGKEVIEIIEKNKNNNLDMDYVTKALAENNISKNKPCINVFKYISLTNLIYCFCESETIKVSKVQRNEEQRHKEYQQFIADILNSIYDSLTETDKETSFVLDSLKKLDNKNKTKNIKSSIITTIYVFVDAEGIIRILDGQHRTCWLYRFLKSTPHSKIDKNLLNFECDGTYENLSKEIKEIFNNLQIGLNCYNRTLTPTEEVLEFIKLNTCSKKLTKENITYSKYGYLKNVNYFKYFATGINDDISQYIINRDSFLKFIKPGSTALRQTYFTKTNVKKLFRLISYSLNLHEKNNEEATIGNLIQATDSMEKEDIVVLLNNFTFLMDNICKLNNTKRFFNTKGCHPKFALIKNMYQLILKYYKLENNEIHLFDEEEIAEAINFYKNSLDEKTKYLNNLSYIYIEDKRHNMVDTLKNTKITDAILNKLNKYDFNPNL